MSSANTLFKNFDTVAITENRKDALDILSAGLSAIDTETAVEKAVVVNDGVLHVGGKEYRLNDFQSIKVVGFGKASCEAAYALERKIGSQIADSAVISNFEKTCDTGIKTYVGTHPKPTPQNVDLTEKIVSLTKDLTHEDLVFVIVSGGGSSLLCWPMEECEQGISLYDKFLTTGGTIDEINIVRKHISLIKGGGLAKLLYPATVIGLIFSDVPGGDYSLIASGPTYKDLSMVSDAQSVIDKYNLGTFNLLETPKEDEYFKKVHNVPVVSNTLALDAMRKRGEELGYVVSVISSALYEYSKELVRMFQSTASTKSVILGGGELRMVVNSFPQNNGGGRNIFTSLVALETIRDEEVFISGASDGKDNSDALGAIADVHTIQKAKGLGIEILPYLQAFDAYHFFEHTEDLLFTGRTGANIADLFLLLSNDRKSSE
ncbi:MAG: DUF4147 domain-containing protein [Candidatus Paceibacterota bacterium]